MSQQKRVKCKCCGKRGKTGSKAAYVRTKWGGEILMKRDSQGNWECSNGYGCDRKKLTKSN